MSDPKFTEVMEPHEFQTLLRGYETLRGVCVRRPSELEPHIVEVYGGINIYGEVHAFETQCDLRGIKSREDLGSFAGLLQKSFEKAAGQLAAGKAL
jgi:hypothetical protein